MLTGSGVALILRIPGMPADATWSFHKWYVFAGVAAFSLLTKYVIRYRGAHLFNPSNIGLVVAFIVLGSGRVEPLDFWWAPLNAWMIAAYAVIITGGLLITARLRLLTVAGSFWVTLVFGLGLLAATGHCMTARWAFAPVCGFDFWRVIVISPEVLIFLFFMITDPKTVPTGRVGRALFGVLVGVASALLIASQTNEFGTKVALLGGLVVVCAARPILDRLVPEPQSSGDQLGRFAGRLANGSGAGRLPAVVRVALLGLGLVVVGGGIVFAGAPARGVVVPQAADILDRAAHDVDPATFPTISVGSDVSDWNHEIAGRGAQAVVLTLVENLELENQALIRGDATLLEAVDHGDRLDEMQSRLADARATGTTVIERYQIDDVTVVLLVPFGKQEALSLGLDSRGTVVTEIHDASGRVRSRSSEPFAKTFVVRQVTGGRWLNVAVLPPGAAS
jgi:hypothetical protein